MTRQQARDVARKAASWAAILFPALAGAWTVAKAVGATKLDVVRFEADSIRRAARDERLERVLNDVDRRTQEMYCAGKPPGCR